MKKLWRVRCNFSPSRRVASGANGTLYVVTVERGSAAIVGGTWFGACLVVRRF